MKTFKELISIDESEYIEKLKKELAQHNKTFDSFAAVGGPPRSHPVHDKIKTVRDKIKKAKATKGVFESEEVDGVDCDIAKEQKAIYDAQTKAFAKDRKQNAKEKVSPVMKESFSSYVSKLGKKLVEPVKDPILDDMKALDAQVKKRHDDEAEDKALVKSMVKKSALKEDEVDEACWDSHKQIGMKMKNGKKVPNCVPKESVEEIEEATYQVSHATEDNKRKLIHTGTHAETAQRTAKLLRDKNFKGVELHKNGKKVNESVFDWKKNKSEVDWKSDDKKPEASKEGGTVYKARDKERNAEVGGDAPKKNVGRPQGDYGSYKIDKATRDDPKYKAELSKKVMAAKAEGFKDREQWKHSMHAEIMKKQLQSAGLNPEDHKDAIAKKNPIKLKN